MIEFIDKTGEISGTPLNRVNMMGIQGFGNSRTTFQNGIILETNADGHTLTTSFGADGSIIEEFVGEKNITKTTIFNADGSITEVIQ